MTISLTTIRKMAAVLLLSVGSCATAMDIAVVDRSEFPSDHRRDFSRLVLRAVMERTVDQFGPYRIDEATVFMERPRLLSELQTGQLVNIVGIQADAQWMKALPYVPIPFDLGLQSWRLLLTNASTQPQLRQMARNGQLAQARAGVATSWVFRTILEQNHYRTVLGNNREGLFTMLSAGRFDYLPRTMTEVFGEFDAFHQKYPRMVIDDSVVLYARVPMLFFIAPHNGRLQQRVTTGMEAIFKDGTLARMVLDYYRPDLQRAQLCGRMRIELRNDSLDQALQARRELWLDPFDPRHGICHRGAR